MELKEEQVVESRPALRRRNPLMEGTKKGLGDGPGGLSRAPLPAALFLARGRRAPEGRAGNPDSFPVAPSPPSPRLLLGRPEANPPLDGRDPAGPAAPEPSYNPLSRRPGRWKRSRVFNNESQAGAAPGPGHGPSGFPEARCAGGTNVPGATAAPPGIPTPR